MQAILHFGTFRTNVKQKNESGKKHRTPGIIGVGWAECLHHLNPQAVEGSSNNGVTLPLIASFSSRGKHYFGNVREFDATNSKEMVCVQQAVQFRRREKHNGVRSKGLPRTL